MDDADTVTGFYDRWTRLYDVIARRTPGIGARRREVADALSLAPGDTVVEMGCGTGANLPYLRERVGPNGQVVGVDVTRGVLDRAGDWIERNGWENVHLVRGDATRPPVTAADAVLASFVVGMLEDPRAAVERWCDLLVPGGRLGLLDSTRSTHPLGRAANPVFHAFVTVTSPPTTRLRYDESLARLLDRRVTEARTVLTDRGEITVDARSMAGFVRLTAGRIP